MKQRSAMLVAMGLVVALALAGLGLVMGMTGPSADAKAPEHSRKPPIVHTTTRTITVHKQGTATTTTMGTTATGFAASTGGSDDQFESSSDDSSQMQSGTETEDSGTSSGTSSSFNEGSDD